MVNFYSITYDANGSTAGITPVMQAAESSRESYYFALDEGKDLRKSGYSFIGWSEDKDAADPKYVAGSTISLSQDAPNKTLYAVWRIDKAWDDITKMQELTPNTCLGLAINTSKQLTDGRDSKVYWVTKLKDGNCWMTQNLDFEPKDATKYTNATLNNWTGAADAAGRYYDPGNYYKTATDNWSITGCNGVTDGFASPGCTTTAGWKTSAANEEEKHFHVGNFYDWYAATNGSWKDADTAGAMASDSICPSGWRLPKGGLDESGSFGTMRTITNETTPDVNSIAGVYKFARSAAGAALVRKDPLYFLPGGRVYGGGLHYAGANAGYWSSVFNGPYPYYFGASSNGAGANNNFGPTTGISVRCLVLSL